MNSLGCIDRIDGDVTHGHFVKVTERAEVGESSESNGICQTCGARVVRYESNFDQVKLTIVDGQIIKRTVNGK
jgi:hypothetical protein